MACFKDSIWIAATAQELFELATTPKLWPRWHHNSVGVVGDVDMPLRTGSVVVEEGKIPGRRGKLTWRCVHCDAPRTLVLEGEGMGGSGTVAYTLKEDGDGTLFTRDLRFSFEGVLMRALEKVVTPRVRQQQTASVRALKTIVEEVSCARRSGAQPRSR